MKYPLDNEDYFRVDAIEKLMRELVQEEHPTLSVKACITYSNTSKLEDHARRECVEYLEATTGLLKEEKFMEL